MIFSRFLFLHKLVIFGSAFIKIVLNQYNMAGAVGNTGDFFYDYFLYPIASREGYNIVNTLAYAIIALIALYGIWYFFKRKNIVVGKQFIYSVIPFVLLGSTISALKDSIASSENIFRAISPVHEFILNSHIYDYGYLTVTPGIYLLTAAILFLCIGILYRLGKMEYLMHVGFALWVPHMLILLPFMQYALDALPIIVLAGVPAIIALRYFKNEMYALIVGSHALDGAATFWVIDVFGPRIGKAYFEQHVVGGFIGELFGTFFAFYLVKVLIAGVVSYTLAKEKEEENFKNFVALAIIIMGLAPAVRNILRMTMGV